MRDVRWHILPLFVIALMLGSCGDPLDPGDGVPTSSLLTGYFSGGTQAEIGLRGTRTEGIPKNTLDWTRCPDGDFFAYILCRAGTSQMTGQDAPPSGIMMTTDPDCTSFDDLDVFWGETYTYSLVTVNDQELSSWSNELPITTPGEVPITPRLEITGVLPGRVDLHWTQCPDVDFLSYAIYRSTVPDIPLHVENADLLYVEYQPKSTSFSDMDSPFDLPVYYAVQTENTKGLTSWSNEVETFAEQPLFPWEPLYEWVLSSPDAACFLPTGGLLFVTSSVLDNVSIFDLTVGSLLTQVPVGENPRGICCSPDGQFVYVCNYSSGSLTTIETTSQTVVRETPLPEYCTQVVCPPNGDRLYVLRPASRQLFQVDAATGAMLDSLSFLGNLGDMTATINESRIYLIDESFRKVLFVETVGFTVEREVTVSGIPRGLTASDDGLLYCSSGNDKLDVINTVTGDIDLTFDLGFYGHSLARLPGSDYLYMDYSYDDNTRVIDATTGELLGDRVFNNAKGVLCSPDGQMVMIITFNSIMVLSFAE